MVLKSLLPSILLENVAEVLEILENWWSQLWTAELGICCSDFYAENISCSFKCFEKCTGNGSNFKSQIA